MKYETKFFKSVASVVMGLAMAFILLPSLKANAATTILAAPKDAKQCEATVDGVKVDWTKVQGATSYVYSWSADKTNYSTEALTGNGGTDNSIGITNTTWKPATTYYVKIRSYNGSTYSEPVVVTTSTAPKAPTYLKETAAEKNSVTVAWDASAGATGYLIRFGANQASAKDIQTVTTTSCKLTGLNADTPYYVAIYPVRKVTNTYSAKSLCVENPRVTTTAPAVSGLKLLSWNVKSNIATLQWKNTAKYESGYQLEISNASGKVLKTYNIYGRRSTTKTFLLKSIKNTPFQYRLRTYTLLNGAKSYGDWSAYAYAVPQANLKATKVNDTSAKLSWDKVAGAKSYIIYRATSEGGKFKKIATTTKSSYTVKNLSTYTDYYFYVKANNVNIGGKKRYSNKVSENNDLNVYIYKYQTEVTND